MTAHVHVPGTLLPAAEPLHQGWSLHAVTGAVPAEIAGRAVPATVPGTTHTDLLDAGLIPDPYLDLNEQTLTWMHRADWRYSTTFTAAPVAADERVDLVFEGLDTIATVRLNGEAVARTANQHRSYRIDVGDRLGATNDLTVDFASALTYAERLEAEQGLRPRPYPHPFVYVRKMACSFGWDWGPDLQTAGIWKPVRLERWRTARLAQVRPLVTVDADGTGRVEAHVEVERARRDDDVPLTVTAQVTGPGGGAAIEARVGIEPGATSGVVTVLVPDVERWWPVGHGTAHRYDLRIVLTGTGTGTGTGTDRGGEPLGVVDRRIGFRAVEVDRSVDEHGTRFTVVVNGVPVFVKGANWIPDDHLLTRIDRARLERRMDQALGANLNLLRVWGGGIYESEDFYDLADERGLMVWQDFPLACGAYAEEEPLAGEFEAEAREQVTRLSSHPSLVLWNGANENLWGFADWGWPAELEGRTWGLGYYTEVFPAIVAELDPTRAYADNSPYSPGFSLDEKHPNDPDHGTHHQWQCWNQRDYQHYGDDVPRFCSEFGWQGPATWATLTRAVPARALNKDSEEFLLHQKAADGNIKLDRGVAAHLPVPDNFEDWHWATSLLQARAVSFAVEHYRSWWPRTAGSIVWQLNDCWPVTSWAAIDGDERLKPLWYALRAAYADRLVTIQPRDGGLAAVVVNDTGEPWSGALVAERTTLEGRVLADGSVPFEVPARGAVVVALAASLLDVQDTARELLVVRAGDDGVGDEGSGDERAGDGDRAGGAREIRAVHTWAEDKDLALEHSPFTTAVTRTSDGYRVDVTAHALVRDLTLQADKLAADASIDRQLVTLLAGQMCSLRVRTTAELDADALTSPRVLRSANSLVTT